MAHKQNVDLHGSVLQESEIALLLIDVINDFAFPEAHMLLEHAVPAARNLRELKRRCTEEKIPSIYANDNFGIWRSDFKQVLTHCLESDCKGREIAELLKPSEDDYFVLKPKHSGFFSTTLSVLLEHLGSSKLIITGFAGNICVFFTANDAYMRDYEVCVPRDCVASNTSEENQHALEQMEKLLKADTRVSKDILLLSENPDTFRAEETCDETKGNEEIGRH